MKNRSWKFLALVLAVVMVMGVMLTACAPTATTEPTQAPATEAPVSEAPTEPTAEVVTPGGELPRNETLYFAGQQWGAVVGWNPLSNDNNNAMALADSAGGSRIVMFETLYMYNMLDGSKTPLIADGDPVWNADKTQMTVKIKAAAKWSDGTPITADDVAYTWACGVKYANSMGTGYGPYIASVEATDASTVVITSTLNEEGKPTNPLQLECFIVQAYIIQKAWLETLEARNTADTIKQDPGDDVVWSGPYTKFYSDDQKVVFVRDDNYWGQDASMWGKLPVPKYLCHSIYADNPAGQVAFAAGEVDVCQQFISNIQDMWEKDGLPISTYLDEPPYGVCVNMPTAWFNMSSFGLDNAAVRKAIAMAVDYDAINTNAMTGQSPTFQQVPRSLMNPTDGEQAQYDKAAIAAKNLQWAGNDIEGAKAILEAAGIVDADGDGYREIDGTKLSYNACCPNGWTDWQAAMEIVAAAGEKIGIEIVTEFPEWSVYQTVVTSASQSDYDIFMMWTDSATPSQPWGRMRMLMSSEFNGVENNWSGNWGHYSNPRIDELVKLIPLESDPAKLKAYFTEAVEIYLTDVPSFSLMYRPDKFHAVNESVWTNYPEAGDGRNIPPMDCTDGYSIAALYDLELVG
ncbi:MAG TPA: ABC transporter substrate-binding protein [Clostridia bacterium]|nr:ABC transporter substrate-binding protein [Clostridia bacterium]